MSEVTLKEITKEFEGGVIAVDKFNINVSDKEFVVLVGPSGCGKSTTLRMVAGLEEITEGDLHIDGKRMNDIPPKNRDIAMVFQNYALYPHMDVFSNMAFGLKLRKFPKEEIRKRVNEAAEILGLSEYLDRKPKALSGGQRQRVAVGRAIVRKPKAFLFDEPLSNLDAKMRVQMRKEICQLHKRLDATMVYVTHDQVEAMTMGDRIVVMKDGLIQQVGRPMDIYAQPSNKFVAGFIGSPPLNFFECTVSEKGVEFNGSTVPVDEDKLKKIQKSGSSTVTLGIRPESLHIEDISEGFQLKGNVDINEPLGSELLVYVATSNNTTFIAKLLNAEPFGINDDVVFSARPEDLYFFDGETEEAIL
ncbi:MAG: sn-glycerol-3-phosphate ABC transporter ATP-binding protein UgpC [Chitinivibrionales bacterium]|nr:sn-glycerol-3-phosphate ABC transporter ATP-binding protein UgpC [Chitinivibrionales bacterium]